MAYEHLGLHPFAVPIPVGPGGRLEDWSAVERLLAEVEPDAEPAPELAERDWVSEEAAGWPVATSLEAAVLVCGVDALL
jgi:hypothetical protein